MKATVSEKAVAFLTRDILSGALPPLDKLKVQHLSARYEIGPTPLREALSQLAARGLVVQQGQRGFHVPPVTRDHLLDITHTRQIIEAEAFRLAIQHGGRAWEDEVCAALMILLRAVEQHETTEGWLDAYEERHHRFHATLIAPCPFATLRRLCDELYAQKTRYRRFLRSLCKPSDETVAMHRRLADRALARDTQGGMEEIVAHIGSTANALLAVLDAGAGGTAAAPVLGLHGKGRDDG